MKTNLKILLNAGSVILILVLAVAAIAIYSSFKSLKEKEYWVDHTNQVLDVSEKILSGMKDIQIGQRGFAITGDSLYLTPYFNSIDSVPQQLSKLRQLTVDNKTQQIRIDTLQIALANAIQVQKYAVMLKANKQAGHLTHLYTSYEAKSKMDRVRQVLHAIMAEEMRLLKVRSLELDNSIWLTKLVTYVVIMSCALLIGTLFFIVRYQFKKRDEDAVKMKDLNEELYMANQELMTYNEELNANREELYATVEQLEQVKGELEKRVIERTLNLENTNEMLTEEIVLHKRTAKELEKRNHELDNYVYKVSHDLRAPLTSILGLINLIQAEKEANVIKHYTNLIENRALKLDDFIKSILNHSKTINSAIQPTEINFSRIISECKEELRYLPNWEKVNITADIQAQTAFYSDELRITILFKNFISNAIKYMNPAISDNYLRCLIQVDAIQAVIHIEDNGIGISPDYKDKIFNMFFRATATSDGSGLGLYIVKQTLEKLEGSIQVESELNRGTTFIINLPNFINQPKNAPDNS